MQYRTFVSAALALALGGGVAQAQTAGTTGTPGVGTFGGQTLPGALGGGSLPGIPSSGGPLLFGSGGFGLSPTFANTFPTAAGNGLVPIGPLQFQPGVGFVPTGFVSPFAGLGASTLVPNGPLQFVPGVGFQATAYGTPAGQPLPTTTVPGTGGFLPPVTNPGYGGYYGGGGYGPYYSGTLVGFPRMGYVAQPGFGLAGYRGSVPIIGINVPAGGLAARTTPRVTRTRVSSGAVLPTEVAMAPGTRMPRQLVAGRRQEARDTDERSGEEKPTITPSFTSQVDPQQIRLANRMENVMEDRPLTEGTVVTVGATGVLVRYEQDGEFRTERFRPAQVFFFHKHAQDSRLASAETDPDYVRKGDRVLVPIAESDPPRISVTVGDGKPTYSSEKRVMIRATKPRPKSKPAGRKK